VEELKGFGYMINFKMEAGVVLQLQLLLGVEVALK
jgi:hypothetical protein